MTTTPLDQLVKALVAWHNVSADARDCGDRDLLRAALYVDPDHARAALNLLAAAVAALDVYDSYAIVGPPPAAVTESFPFYADYIAAGEALGVVWGAYKAATRSPITDAFLPMPALATWTPPGGTDEQVGHAWQSIVRGAHGVQPRTWASDGDVIPPDVTQVRGGECLAVRAIHEEGETPYWRIIAPWGHDYAFEMPKLRMVLGGTVTEVLK